MSIDDGRRIPRIDDVHDEDVAGVVDGDRVLVGRLPGQHAP